MQKLNAMDIKPSEQTDPKPAIPPVVDSNPEGEKELFPFAPNANNILIHLNLLGEALQNMVFSFSFNALPLPQRAAWTERVSFHTQDFTAHLTKLILRLTLLIESKGFPLHTKNEKAKQEALTEKTLPGKSLPNNGNKPTRRIQLLQQIKTAMKHISVMQKNAGQSQEIVQDVKKFLAQVKEQMHTLSQNNKLSTFNKHQLTHLIYESEKGIEKTEKIIKSPLSKEESQLYKNELPQLIKDLTQLKKTLSKVITPHQENDNPSAKQTKMAKKALENNSNAKIVSFPKTIELKESKRLLINLMQQDLDIAAKKGSTTQPAFSTAQNFSKSINSYIVAPYTPAKTFERRNKKKKKKEKDQSFPYNSDEELQSDLPYNDFE